MKPIIFKDLLKTDESVLYQTIIFVETMEYGNGLLPTIHPYTHLYRTYYADDERTHLIEFAEGRIDCLITCHRLSQGIDIHSLRNIILFSSARAKLETIQRIGRCLRIDRENPNKRATVIDFVRTNEDDEFPNADDERREWLTSISKVKRGDYIAP